MAITSILNDINKYVKALNNKKKFNSNNIRLGKILNCPVFVVNLKRSKYRREFILNYLKEFGIDAKIHDAVEGNKLNISELESSNIYDDEAAHQAFSRSLTMPEIGTALSHIGVYKEILDLNIDRALVLEDDVMFQEGAVRKIEALLEEVPDDWDIIQLYYRCKDYEEITGNVVRFLSKTCIPVGAPGYIIRNTGAKKLLDNAYPIRYPSDSLIGRSPRWGTSVYGSLPQLVILNNLFPTEIHKQRGLIQKATYHAKHLIVRLLGRFFSK